MTKIKIEYAAVIYCFIQLSTLHGMSEEEKAKMYSSSENELAWDTRSRPQSPLLMQEKRPKTRCHRLGNCVLYNSASLLVLAVTGAIAWGGYRYYDDLYSSCNEMETSCNECTNQFNAYEGYVKTVIQFIEQCPNASQLFMPQVVGFLEGCCKEQGNP